MELARKRMKRSNSDVVEDPKEKRNSDSPSLTETTAKPRSSPPNLLVPSPSKSQQH